MSTKEDAIKQLELKLYYIYEYREADFVPLRKQAESTLFTYAELLQMELDTLEYHANHNTNSKRA